MRVDLRVKHDVEARKAAIGLFELGHGIKSAVIVLSLPVEAVRRWQEIYRAFGSEVLLRMDGKQGRYTYEQKVAAASAVVDGGMTKTEAMAAFGIMSMLPLKKRCALYRRGGAEPCARGPRAGRGVPLLDGRGKHRFRAGAPNELWITDVTEFRIPAGKTYLSPIIDCFDGMPISWTISATPDAEMANSSLLGACSQLKEGEHSKGHNDRCCRYRWSGWIKICDDHGIVRLMSGRG